MGSYLVDVRFDTDSKTTPKTTIVKAVIRGTNPPAGQVKAMEAKLPTPLENTKSLHNKLNVGVEFGSFVRDCARL